MTVQISDIDSVKTELLALLEQKESEIKYNKLFTLFPSTGPFRRELYPKHVAFMNAGRDYPQRAFIAANRTGKSLTVCTEATYHLTGLYPDWWEGRRFLNPTNGWAVGETTQSTKESIIEVMLGPSEDIGTGTIPKHLIIGEPKKKSGGGEFIEKIRVRHISGGISTVVYKTYEQERESFQGAKKDWILLDEEPKKMGVFTECLTRTSDKFNPGIILCAFTPLRSLSDIVQSFIPGGKFPEGGVNPKNPYRYVTNVTWDEVPHMNDEQKIQFLASYSEHEKYARSLGIPGLGAGAIYPYPEPTVTVTPFKIPQHWPRAYGLDVGWNRTAAIWGAKDLESEVIYLYSEHYEAAGLPVIHAKAIKGRGDWIPGVIDPAARGRQGNDGSRLIDLYEDEGLLIERANNEVDSGLFATGQLLAGGGLKIFTTCTNLLDEYRVYCRDENGKIVKKNDHLMDAMRYLIMSFDNICQEIPTDDYERKKQAIFGGNGRNNITGY